MPEMILNRNAHLNTRSGHALSFKKGQPTWVPPICVRDAIAIGAEHNDDADHSEDFADTPRANIGPADEAARQEDILKAVYKLIEINDRDDFTAAGSPTVVAVKDTVGYKVAASEIAKAWQTYHDQVADAKQE